MASKASLRPSRPTFGERPIKAKPSPEYSARKAALTDEGVRQLLELAEQSIAVDPHHRYRRMEVDGIVYDYSETGLMVSFTIVNDEVVYLSFRDLFD